MQAAIEQKIAEHFQPVYMEVLNESHMHNVPPGSESHFKVTLVSEEFEGKRLIARHQAVYAQLSDEMSGGIHALALHTYSPTEWALRESAPDSPQCLGGSKKESH